MIENLRMNPAVFCPVPSLADALQLVADQIGVCPPETAADFGEYQEIALIVAEMYMRDPNSYIRIAGETLPVRLVQEVYFRLDEDHIAMVQEHFEQIHTRIRCAKWYLQTALYNAVFELAHDAANAYAVDREGAHAK